MLGAGCALLPTTYLVVRAATGDNGVGTLLRGQTLLWAGNSAVLVVAVASACLVLGVGTAWLLVCSDLPGRRAWTVAAAMPLAVPSYVAGFGWLTTLPGLQGFWPTWAVLTAACVPYVTLPVVAVLRNADNTLVEMAQVSGRGRWATWTVGLGAQVAPAAAAGALLAALYTLADFGTPALMRHQVLTFAIFRQYGSFVGRDRAVLLAVLLVLAALALFGLERLVRGNARRWSVSSGAARPLRRVSLGRLTTPALLVAALPVLVAVVVPCAALFRRLMLGTRRPLDPSELAAAATSTVTVALLGGLLAMALAACVGVLAARYDGRLVAAVETTTFSAHALPGLVVGLSLVYLSLRVVPGVYQTLAVLVFAYAVLFMPKAVGAIRTSVGAVPPILGQVASSLGRGPVGSALVTARIAGPGVAAGFLLVVVTAMKELPATLLLRPSGMDTLATELWGRTSSSAQGAAAPYALMLVLLASIPAVLLTRTSAWDES